MRDINKIIIHCSDSEWGDVNIIDQWHKDRGWDGVGYHAIILNGCKKSSATFKNLHDGVIQEGRDFEIQGAHCRGHNRDSIGICLIGKHHFTQAQFISLMSFLRQCMETYNIKPDNIYGHYEFSDKTCPNMDVKHIRDKLNKENN